jgi:hypothetical protein
MTDHLRNPQYTALICQHLPEVEEPLWYGCRLLHACDVAACTYTIACVTVFFHVVHDPTRMAGKPKHSGRRP